MKVKLTNSELWAFIMALNATVLIYQNMMLNKALDMEGKMYKALYEEIMVYLQQKALIKQEKYTIKIKPSWAMAIWIEYCDTADFTSQAGNLLNKLCNEIHQRY